MRAVRGDSVWVVAIEMTGQERKMQATLFTDSSLLQEFFVEYARQRLSNSVIKMFQNVIYDYYHKHGRQLPWRETTDPYHVLVAEMMLQQTQVKRVIPKYKHFLACFPTFEALAAASLEEVLAAWQGLGYNRRALALQKTARIVVKLHHGRLPSDAKELQKLPGIGKYTANAILAFAFNKPVVVIETNIRAVYIYFFFNNKRAVTDDELTPLLEKTMDRSNPRKWYNALMDYGVMLKKTLPNPTRKSKHYRKQAPFKGSNREIRGKILRLLLTGKSWSLEDLAQELSSEQTKVTSIVDVLEKEGFLKKEGDVVRIKSKND